MREITADTITDEEIQALRAEARACGDVERARCCSAALGLPISDGALGRLDPRTCRERIAEIFRHDRRHLRETTST